ncbi:MAG TPA: macro domain-containing protein [Candidatus Limnocylindrales bacterium]|jgi:O-acetyl-ADP-ribose deacetylase (regulator of RNase III)|nr:macro domain-containing protein [Candidatus Limnocylindrales bacterium]
MDAHEVRIGADRLLAAIVGDITQIKVDAIVNAANSALAGGGGVDGAIHRAGGPEIMADLDRRHGRARFCPTGGAVLSGAGQLQAQWVIHAVGPVWYGGRQNEAELLASAYRTAFRLADAEGATSIAFPAISCGVYRYPLEPAAAIAADVVAEELASAETIRAATFVLFSLPTFEVFSAAIDRAGAASS